MLLRGVEGLERETGQIKGAGRMGGGREEERNLQMDERNGRNEKKEHRKRGKEKGRWTGID